MQVFPKIWHLNRKEMAGNSIAFSCPVCVCVNPSSFLFIRFFFFVLSSSGEGNNKTTTTTKERRTKTKVSQSFYFYFLYSSLDYYNSKRDPTKWRMINSSFFFFFLFLFQLPFLFGVCVILKFNISPQSPEERI